jgi:hypothetical protein
MEDAATFLPTSSVVLHGDPELRFSKTKVDPAILSDNIIIAVQLYIANQIYVMSEIAVD